MENITRIIVLISLLNVASSGFVKRCFSCRSRGVLGDCGDPFDHSDKSVNDFRSVESTPCTSGWCGKVIEGLKDDYGLATQRMCLQRPPNDLEERCSETVWQRRKVLMCMCKGDLCNVSSNLKHNSILITALSSICLMFMTMFL